MFTTFRCVVFTVLCSVIKRSVCCATDRVGDLKLIKKIGEGVFGEVFSARHDGQHVALKVHPSTCSIFRCLPVF